MDKVLFTALNTTFKEDETTKVVRTCFKKTEHSYYYPDPDHSYLAKVMDDNDQLIKIAPVTLDGNWFCLSSKELTDLTAGEYTFEIWENYADNNGQEATVYPSPGYRVPLTIEVSANTSAQKEIKKIGFQEVVNQAVLATGQNIEFEKPVILPPDQEAKVAQKYENGKLKVTISVPKGEKGETGPMTKFEAGTVTKLAYNDQPTINLIPIDGGYRIDLGIPAGEPGKDGHTPEINKDYWTDADQQKIKDDVTKTIGDAYTKAKSDIEDLIENGKW